MAGKLPAQKSRSPLWEASDVTSVLEYFCRLAETSDRPSAGLVLQKLRDLFDATAIGLNALDAAEPDRAFSDPPHALPTVPWQTDAGLLHRIRTSSVAESHATQAGAWLISAVQGPGGDETCLAWVYRSPKRTWSESERWQWTAASHALARWLSQPTAAADETRGVRRRLEQAAIITGRLTHDFGNFLTGILGFTELGLSQAPPDTSQQRYLQEVLQSAQNAAAWIHRLHLFCRRGETSSWPTRLASVLALEEARVRSAEASKLRFEINLPNDLPLLDMDADLLQVVLREVVNNAREAIKTKGTIAVVARPLELTAPDCRELLGAVQPGPHVELSITDDGPGIAVEARARLFHEIFYSTKPRRRGIGLLAVYGILQRFHGGLRLESAGAGKGVCVRLYIPAASIEGPALAIGTKPPSVLLVHATPLLFDSLRLILEARGCRVSIADSPEAAFAAYVSAQASFALVVVDVTMPQMSGFDFARRILDHDNEANLLFLYTQVSFHGLAEEELLKRFEMLRWPLKPSAFLSAVQTALARVQS